MSDYKPITGELRERIGKSEHIIPLNGETQYTQVRINLAWLKEKLDTIDAIHAGLERENAVLHERLAEMNEQSANMHGGGSSSITDELRELTADPLLGYASQKVHKEVITAIADRIDAEHERQLEVLYRDMSDAEYVKLSKDTGDEYIHEHDNVDWRDHAGTWHENATVVAVCNDGCYVMDGTVFHVHKSDIRHHHVTTVEDVLREFALKVAGEECMTMRTGVVEEYAEKLREVMAE